MDAVLDACDWLASRAEDCAFPTEQIKRVRIVHRADDYYVQFAVRAERAIVHQPTGKQVGIDVGLRAYYTDSEGNTVDNPRHYRKAEQNSSACIAMCLASRRKSTAESQETASKGVSESATQREDFARKTASTLSHLTIDCL